MGTICQTTFDPKVKPKEVHVRQFMAPSVPPCPVDPRDTSIDLAEYFTPGTPEARSVGIGLVDPLVTTCLSVVVPRNPEVKTLFSRDVVRAAPTKVIFQAVNAFNCRVDLTLVLMLLFKANFRDRVLFPDFDENLLINGCGNIFPLVAEDKSILPLCASWCDHCWYLDVAVFRDPTYPIAEGRRIFY